MPSAHAGIFSDAERSHSGLVHRSRKPEWLNGHRGFESHPLRHVIFEDSRLQDLHDCYRIYMLILKNLVNPVNDYLKGEVQEWLNWQHWKCCERGTVPWVRIPPSPPSDFSVSCLPPMTGRPGSFL